MVKRVDEVIDAPKLTTKVINGLLGIDDSYKAPQALMEKLFEVDAREQLFREFLSVDSEVSRDYFTMYFQDEHADRKVKKQDFTPDSVSKLVAELVGGGTGSTLDVAAGTGGMTIAKWQHDRINTNIFEYKPSMFFYQCEELSDRAIPFLLFNLMLRGMNATVVHGDTLTREISQVYFIQNEVDNFLGFSSLNVMPRTQTVEAEFNVNSWVGEPIDHIESKEMPMHLLGTLEDMGFTE